MEKSKLKPFLRKDLHILFVGLNPAKGSSDKGHYFSVNQAFWNQLYESGLIIRYFDKNIADEYIFGGNQYNFNNWEYGITDLVPEYAESYSLKIKPTKIHSQNLKNVIIKYNPRVVCLLHSTVINKFLRFLGYDPVESNAGEIGKLIPGNASNFFAVAFPHGNNIPSNQKVEVYKKIKNYLINQGY